MKKIIVPIVFLVCLSTVSFIIFIKADDLISNEEAIKIGEEKYMKFLWLVDGAFNNERMNGEFIVNGKKMNNKDKVFTCKYQKNNIECVGNNFEKEFSNLFSNNIRYDNVYSDGNIYSWYKYQNNKYVFNNLNNCNINRMGLNHKLNVDMISKDELIYDIVFIDNQIEHVNKKKFILVLENNEWKISKAYYHDLCGMNYYIE